MAGKALTQPKVEMMIQVTINGRPIWRMAKKMRPELAYLATDKEYDIVLNSAMRELAEQIRTVRDRAEKTKEKVGA